MQEGTRHAFLVMLSVHLNHKGEQIALLHFYESQFIYINSHNISFSGIMELKTQVMKN